MEPSLKSALFKGLTEIDLKIPTTLANLRVFMDKISQQFVSIQGLQPMLGLLDWYFFPLSVKTQTITLAMI